MATGFGGVQRGNASKNMQSLSNFKGYNVKSSKGVKTKLVQENFQNLPSKKLNTSRAFGVNRFEVALDNFSSHNKPITDNQGQFHSSHDVGEVGFPRVENRVRINLDHKTREERRELRKKLEAELHSVRLLVSRIENKGGNTGSLREERCNDLGKLMRVHSEVGSVGWHESRPAELIDVVMPDLRRSGRDDVGNKERIGKEKRPNQSLNLTVHKENVTPSEHIDELQGIDKKSWEFGYGFETTSALSIVFKRCNILLSKLMSHKAGWIFNSPVDVKALGLSDYFKIIKHPMDLGTIKTRLNANWYKSPWQFAEDVRLTFSNAMTYNPRGHDVHKVAATLLKIFEDKWLSIEADYTRELKPSKVNKASHLKTTMRKAPSPLLPASLPPPVDTIRRLGSLDSISKAVGAKPIDRSESITKPINDKPINIFESLMNPVVSKSKNKTSNPSDRTPVPMKPNAKDPHKQDMTYMEKQKLSIEIQNLPSEKLDQVVQIIQKRSPSLFHDDEIELDIDSIDTETLWELDRFVRNFKMNVSKINSLAEPNVE